MLMLCFDKIDGREINNETAVFGCEYTGIALQMSCFSRKMLYDQGKWGKVKCVSLN